MEKKIKPYFVTKSIICFLGIAVFTGCGKKDTENLVVKTSPSEIKTKHSRTLNGLKLGESSDFAILAYASITSAPSSSIDGKVGLFPGTRKQIALDTTEVIGGAAEIFGSDDETHPINLLSNAKVDMVSAYKDAIGLTPDEDKIGLYDGKLSSKILSPGCYKWNEDLIILNDFTLEGSQDDVWIFKIPANLKVAKGVHLILSGGANPKNIFWQVAGSAILESSTDFAGTIISQQFVEMKNHSQLTGRAFAKNGYIILDHAIIKKP